MKNFAEKFKNPPREYGIYPIVHGGIAYPENNLEAMKNRGFAGVVGNVPYGRDYPDDSAEWKRTAEGFRAYAENGMKTWIYDEKGYPSGTAGGVVLERNPEYETIGLICYDYWKSLEGPSYYRADVPEGELYKALLVPIDGGEAIDITDTLNEKQTLYFDIPKGVYRLLTLTIRRLFDGTHAAHSFSEPRRMINLLQKEATQAFLKVTHEKYAEVLGDEFGKSVRAFFTDEPSLMTYNIPAVSYPFVSWRRDFPEVFEKRYGYDIAKAVVAVVKGAGPEYIKRRCDFWEFTADELAENFFGTIQDFCHANGLASSGHMLAEEILLDHLPCYGSYYTCAKRLDWPGIDQLESEPSMLMRDDIIPIARLAASPADVFGIKETFTEASDHCSRCENRQISIDWVRASMNWHFAQGITNVTSYYGWAAFSDEQIRQLNKYVARLGTALREGERYSKVAVLYPDAALWATFALTGDERTANQPERARRLSDAFAKTSWELLHRQVDFDYVDEKVINDAKLEKGTLRFGTRAYTCVVLPCAYVVKGETMQKLAKLLKSGGSVIVIGAIPEYDRNTGEKGDFYKLFTPYLESGRLEIIPIDEGWTIPVTAALPRTIKLTPGSLQSVLTGAAGNVNSASGEVISPNILTHVRKKGKKLIAFVCNMCGTPYSGVMTVKGEKCTIADPDTGILAETDANASDGIAHIALSLGAYDAKIYIIE
ncbi:MAG: hypothetical protein E7491_08440 [Ruminococcaceae bacterium]|nr:hypothetical protein [Oscillospiraceae bacterium]